MWQATDDVLDAALRDAERRMPNEACGLIRDGRYYPLRNISPTPETAFLLSDREYIRFIKEVGQPDAVAHSHVYLPPLASEIDRVCCEQTGIPWLIVAVPQRTHTVIRPNGYRAPLVGRQWAWGVHDCFGLIRDGIKDYAGVDLPNVHREWEFWINDFDFIRSQMDHMGFVELPRGSKPQHCDVLGMRLHGKVVNHLGLFLAPDRLLHQLSMRLSVIDVYGGTYQRLTELHMRHREIIAAGMEAA